MQKVFGFILALSFLIASPTYAGFYPLKPKDVYDKAIVGTILPKVEENTTEELPKDLPILIGVFITDGLSKAIFYLPKERKKKAVVGEGEEVEGFIVRKINEDSVELERGGKIYTVGMFSQEAKSTRDRRRRVVYVPPPRRIVEGVEKVSPPPSPPGMGPSLKPAPINTAVKKGSNTPDRKAKTKKAIGKRAKSFIELLKSLSRKAREGGNAPRKENPGNPFLRLFQGR